MAVFQVPTGASSVSGSLAITTSYQTVNFGFVPDVILICGKEPASAYLESAVITGAFISNGAETNLRVVDQLVTFVGNGKTISIKSRSTWISPLYYTAVKF